MDLEQRRLYIREWKLNKPYLPKSTSLPLLRLTPQNRAIFVCKQCGFSNFLVPMCLWCCWSSAEARHEFEVHARKTLRRARRSAPRLFSKPGLSMSSQGVRARKHHCSTAHHAVGKAQTFRRPYISDHGAVSSASTGTTTVFGQQNPAQLSPQRLWNTARNNGDRGGRISGLRKVNGQSSQGLYAEYGIDDFGTGSSENYYNPVGVEFQHPRLPSVFVPPNHPQAGGHDKDASLGFSPSSSLDLQVPTSDRAQPCLQLFEKPQPSTLRFPARTLLATLISSRGPREPLKDCATENFRVTRSRKNKEPKPKTKSSLKTMLLDRSTVDTRCNATTASYIVESPATDAMTTVCDEMSTVEPECDYCNYQDSLPMDVDHATLVHSNQAPTSSTKQTEVCTPAGQRAGSDLDVTTGMTLTKAGERRTPIPNTLLQKNSACSDTPITSGHQAFQIPVTTEMIAPVEKHSLQSQSPARTLKRRKRLSLAGLSSRSTSNLVPPDLPIPLSPPPLQTSTSPQLSPTFATPPNSPGGCNPVPVNFSPTIVLSTPTSTTPMLVQSSRPIPPPTIMPSQTLPRIGTPKRPYYSTIRANRNAQPASSVSPVTTPPASPSSSTFASACGSSQSPASGGTPGSPDRSIHLGAGVVERLTSLQNDSTETANGMPVVRPAPHRSASNPAIQTVPPLLPVIINPLPAPTPVQMYAQPSSPVRSILSVLNPDQGGGDDEDDDESTYHHFGMNSSRFGRVLRERRSGNMKEKNKARDHGGGGYQFPLSLSFSLGRKRGRTLATANQKPDLKGDPFHSPTLSPSRSCIGLGGIGMGTGYSVSGEVEMRMALAERSLNANGGSAEGLEPSFKFRRENTMARPSFDADIRVTRSKSTSKLTKMRSTIGLSSTSLTTSPPRSPSSMKLGSRLKEMSANFLGKFQGGDSSRV